MFYCVSKPVAGKEDTVTTVSLHNGFGVHPHGASITLLYTSCVQLSFKVWRRVR